MFCHYFEENSGFGRCVLKGITPPTLTELRLFCRTARPHDCPVYQHDIQHRKSEAFRTTMKDTLKNQTPILENDPEPDPFSGPGLL